MKNDYFTVMIAGMAKPGMEDYVRRNLFEIMKNSRHDQGCITYNIHESIKTPGEFMVYMVWKDEKSFEKHNQTAIMQEFKKQLSHEWFEAQSSKTYWHLLNSEQSE